MKWRRSIPFPLPPLFAAAIGLNALGRALFLPLRCCLSLTVAGSPLFLASDVGALKFLVFLLFVLSESLRASPPLSRTASVCPSSCRPAASPPPLDFGPFSFLCVFFVLYLFLLCEIVEVSLFSVCDRPSVQISAPFFSYPLSTEFSPLLDRLEAVLRQPPPFARIKVRLRSLS